MNLKPYKNYSREASLYKNVPIELREAVLAHFSQAKVVVRLKFRGPRSQSSRSQRQATCLLRDAKRFSVYFK
jgi:hypothetical protein